MPSVVEMKIQQREINEILSNIWKVDHHFFPTSGFNTHFPVLVII